MKRKYSVKATPDLDPITLTEACRFKLSLLINLRKLNLKFKCSSV